MTSCNVSMNFPPTIEGLWTPQAEKEGIQHLKTEGVDVMKILDVPYAPNGFFYFPCRFSA